VSTLREDDLPPSKLLFDPNNYRFQDLEGFVYAAEERFHEDTVQSRAYLRIRQEEGLLPLKASIMRNGYMRVERLVVRPYEHSGEDRYLVIEGNRRLAAVRWVLEDHAAGVKVRPEVLESIQRLPVVVAEEGGRDEIFRASLMGIRHVGGIREWGGYQRAKLVATMRDQLGLEASEVAERLVMTTHEVNRRYRAFKALQQMMQDEDFADYAKPNLYPIFHEAVSLPAVKTWLDWDDASTTFRNQESLRTFYGLITPTASEEGPDRPPKIPTREESRELRNILPNPDAMRLLIDPTRTFSEALSVAKREELSRLWAVDVSAAIRALETISITELKTLSGEDVLLLERLRDKVGERLVDHSSLVRVPPQVQ
jgi:hypothetical protein